MTNSSLILSLSAVTLIAALILGIWQYQRTKHNPRLTAGPLVDKAAADASSRPRDR